jgi:hypothetical protein
VTNIVQLQSTCLHSLSSPVLHLIALPEYSDLSLAVIQGLDLTTAEGYWCGGVACPLECGNDRESRKAIAKILGCEGFELIRGFGQRESRSTCFLNVNDLSRNNLHCLDI